MADLQAPAADGLRVSLTEVGVLSLTLDRPERKNAVSQAMWHGLADLFTAIANDRSVRAVIVTGAGADFCAGADISEFETVRRDAATARAYEAANSRAFAAIRDCPVPTIAAIAGICFGGGFGIAAACDLRIATPDSVFSVPAARLGLAYPHDAMVDILSAAGPQMAKYLAFTADRIDAARARAAGFLLELAGDVPALHRRAAAIAGSIAASAPLSVRASKASIRATMTRDPADVARATELGAATFDSADYAEGRAAFAERRKPVFTGR